MMRVYARDHILEDICMALYKQLRRKPTWKEILEKIRGRKIA